MQAFTFLESAHGFRRTRTEYSASSFGNVIAEYRSPALCIRVTRDRSQFFCSFARPGTTEEWFDHDVILQVLGEIAMRDALVADSWLSLESVASSVEQNVERIGELFAEPAFEKSRELFHERQRIRAARLFGGEGSA